MFSGSVIKAIVCASFFVDGKVITVTCGTNVFTCVIARLQFAEVLKNRKCHGAARDGLVLAGKSWLGSPLPFLNVSFRNAAVDAPGKHG
jgi:hypothetical protein